MCISEFYEAREAYIDYKENLKNNQERHVGLFFFFDGGIKWKTNGT